MVGNDVVDLLDTDADPATLSSRFDERAFCPEERESLASAPERRWTLWAAKEAAYKVAVKQDPATVFAPPRFRVRLDAEAELGRVTWPGGSVRVRVRVADGAVHAVATTADERVLAGLERLSDAGGHPALEVAARRLASRRVAEALGVDPGEVRIAKRGRVPELFVGDARADLSLSHHGGVVGFACEISALRALRAAGPALRSESRP